MATTRLLPVETLWSLGTVETCALFYKYSHDLFTVDMSQMNFLNDLYSSCGVIYHAIIHSGGHTSVYLMGYTPHYTEESSYKEKNELKNKLRWKIDEQNVQVQRRREHPTSHAASYQCRSAEWCLSKRNSMVNK